MRLIRDGLLALLVGFVVTLIVVATNPDHLERVLWFAIVATVLALATILWLDWKRDWVRGRLRALSSFSPIIFVWRGLGSRQITRQGWVSPKALVQTADPPDTEPQEPTPSWEDMNRARIARYEETRGLFLVHEWWTPSQEPGQVADVTIRLQQHGEGPLSRGAIRAVEYTLGPKFTNHSLVRSDSTDGYAIHEAMWGPMLCLAKVYFTDGSRPLLLERYVNFDQDAESHGVSDSGAAPTFTVATAASEQTAPSPEPRHTVYVRVDNYGPRASFIADMTGVDGAVTSPPVPWSCKWREGDEREMVIHRGSSALLELFESVPMGHEPLTELRPAVLVAKLPGRSVEMRPRVDRRIDLYEKDIGFTLEVRNTLTDEVRSFALAVGIQEDAELSPRMTLDPI